MTREEKAIKVLKENYDYHVNYDSGDYDEWGDDLAEAVKMAIKALEQEPSCDMVSREVFEQVMWERDVAIKQLKELGYELGEKPKTGHWIPLGNYDDYGNERSYKCSECGDIDTYDYNFCPNCGAKMVELQESEDNE